MSDAAPTKPSAMSFPPSMMPTAVMSTAVMSTAVVSAAVVSAAAKVRAEAWTIVGIIAAIRPVVVIVVGRPIVLVVTAISVPRAMQYAVTPVTAVAGLLNRRRMGGGFASSQAACRGGACRCRSKAHGERSECGG